MESNELRDEVNPREIEDEMKSSFLDYAMSVIVSRALPDVRDGLKPVHRRILFAMRDMGNLHNRPFKKSARIVGEVLGKYHPHGDMSVYDAMVRLAQDFSMRYMLVQGQGNFGSIDGDSAAAMRYTEARLDRKAEEMLEDIDKNTVKFMPNFDGSLQEPMVLPSKFPNLLVNGSSGIAVGMATNIPPHNLNEVLNAIIQTVDNPDISIIELMDIITGPDFPTGGIILGRSGIKDTYLNGRGRVVVRAKTHTEEKGNRNSIIITEIPFMVNKAVLIEQIADMVKNKIIEGISDIRDESDRTGMRVVIELKRDAHEDIVLNQLFKHTRLQVTFGANMLALEDSKPRIFSLKEFIEAFIKHRIRIIRRRTAFDLKKAQQKAHILEGLLVALNNIDRVIPLIRASKSVESARSQLTLVFKLSEEQAQAILDMKLQKLTSLEQHKIKDDQAETLKMIAEYKSILDSEVKVRDIIKNECEELKRNYGDERKTEIDETLEDGLDIGDLIQPEDVVVTISQDGYVKRVPLDTYKAQHRGGKGIIGAGKKEEDAIEHLFVANTHSYLLLFTDKGILYWIKVYMIPEASRQSKGKAVINLLQLDKDETITAFIPVKEFSKGKYLMMATNMGTVKKTPLEAFSNPRRGGIRAIHLLEGEHLENVILTNGKQEVILATSNGLAIRFNEANVRPMGRASHGVRGIRLRKGDSMIGMVRAGPDKTLLTITQNGYGKRTPINEYRLISRGGKGVINIKTTQRNGRVVAVRTVDELDELMFVTKNGIVIRMPSKDISTISRNTQGVRIMRLKQGDEVVAAARILGEREVPNGIEKAPEPKKAEGKTNGSTDILQQRDRARSDSGDKKSDREESPDLFSGNSELFRKRR